MEILTRYREPLIQAMDALLEGPPSPLLTMCRYHLGLAEADGKPTRDGAGKMLRPALCLAVCEALGGDIRQCLPAALSLELTHRTSLVFDDIQDRSPLRNHRPTVWGVWGVDQALNAGLGLSCYARLALHGMLERGVSPQTVLEVHRVLEGTVIDLCRGQYLDLRYREERPILEQYLEMVRLKTGVLLGTACEVGVVIAGAEQKRLAARCFGQSLGVAFQLQDDYLGAWGDPQVMGKANDLKDRKCSLPIVLAADLRVAEQLDKLSDEAEAAAQLRLLLDVLGVRESAECQVEAAVEKAKAALHTLELPSSWEATLAFAANFVAYRSF